MSFRHKTGALLLLLILSSLPARAQDLRAASAAGVTDPAAPPQSAPEERKPSPAGRFLRDVWTDQKAIWSSPARLDRRRFFQIALPLAVAAAGLIATDEKAADWLPNTPDQVRWSGRASKIGAAYALGGLTGGLMIAGKITHKPAAFRIGVIAAEALANSAITNYAIKGVTLRERPDQDNGEGRFWHGGASFPSGHAMNTFAVAAAVARSPNCPKWLAVTSYAVATVVSLSRWGAQKHFPSDILVGGVLGGLIGNYVATRPR